MDITQVILDDHGEQVLTTTFGTLVQLFERTGGFERSFVLPFAD